MGGGVEAEMNAAGHKDETNDKAVIVMIANGSTEVLPLSGADMRCFA